MENTQIKAVKTGFAGFCAITAYLFGAFTPVVYIMVIFEILDYLTGIVAAVKTNGGLSSEAALWGFVKKLAYFVMVGVAFLFDFVIAQTSGRLGLAFEWPTAFGIMSVCYLTSTEGISIMENLQELGVKIPFLTGALKTYREKVAQKGGTDE